MKKLLFVLLLSPLLSFAQTDTVKVKPLEIYCMVIAAPKVFGSGMKLSVDYGKEQNEYTESEIKTAGALSGFKSVVAGLNYMSEHGWELVNSYSYSISTGAGFSNFVLNYVYRRKI